MPAAQAGLIFSFGWSDFDRADPLIPNLMLGAGGALESRIALTAGVSVSTTGGSLDGDWGPLAADSPGTDADGFLNFNNRDFPVYFYLKNTSPGALDISLSNIYFDASKSNAVADGTFSLVLDAIPDSSQTAYVPAEGVFTDFSKVAGSPQAFFLNPGEEKLLLSFTRTGNRVLQLDNIRVDGTFSVIPEVPSTLLFGALLASGLVVRRRTHPHTHPLTR